LILNILLSRDCSFPVTHRLSVCSVGVFAWLR
jgi:hypothetical protein